MRLSRPASWHQNMPGHRLSARIREGRQNSRGRSHALPKAPKCRQAALRQWPGALAHPTGRFSGLPRFSLCEIRHKPRSSSFLPGLALFRPLALLSAHGKVFPVCPAIYALHPPINPGKAKRLLQRLRRRFSGFGPAGFAKQQVALDWQCAASYARNSSRFANFKISPLMPLPLRRSSARHLRVQKGRTRLACRKAGRCGPGLPSGREST